MLINSQTLQRNISSREKEHRLSSCLENIFEILVMHLLHRKLQEKTPLFEKQFKFKNKKLTPDALMRTVELTRDTR